VRTFGIWVFGLSAAAIVGAILAATLARVANPYAYGNGEDAIFGMVGGMCLFACLRLWLAPNSK
jgi:hypothetical protein